MNKAADALNTDVVDAVDGLNATPPVSVSEVWDMQQQLRFLLWREDEKNEVLEHEEDICNLRDSLEACPKVLHLQMNWVRPPSEF